MSTFCIDKLALYHSFETFTMYGLQRCLYTDDWMRPGVVVRKVFPALLFLKLIVSLVTAANKIISQ